MVQEEGLGGSEALSIVVFLASMHPRNLSDEEEGLVMSMMALPENRNRSCRDHIHHHQHPLTAAGEVEEQLLACLWTCEWLVVEADWELAVV